ncbi:beta-lactamase-like protein [Rhodotorula diobovata]|uniref:hydroxyacylglutathione hydrolase n=1 Tax=Rhodotorula diobovata TaxID=5288 RepID=A0A5C5FRD8_9BASI|nr:beta-lactamase-like protein [Rhodotorula diobovata]
MRVIPVPCRSDNYEYIIVDEKTGTTAVVDPYDPPKLQAAAEKEGIKLGQYLLTTHGHHDHAGGNDKTAEAYPGIKVYAGGEGVPAVTDVLKHGDKFKVGELDVTAVYTPCHTRDHICYYVEDKAKDERAVFTGDTLFISGCGRFFEGEPHEMHAALNEKLAALPDDTKVFCGHEYTNVAFSQKVDPENAAIQKLVKFCEENDVTTGKFTIGDEKQHNVFMRTTSPAVQKATGTSDAIKAMGVLREMKASLDQACSRREGAFELRSEPRLTRFRCAQNKG